MITGSNPAPGLMVQPPPPPLRGAEAAGALGGVGAAGALGEAVQVTGTSVVEVIVPARLVTEASIVSVPLLELV